MAEDVILEKDDENSNVQKLDEGLDKLKGEEGEAPKETETQEQEEVLFSFSRESAPHEESQKEQNVEEQKQDLLWYKDKKFMSLVWLSLGIVCVLIYTLFYLSFSEGKIKPDIIATKTNQTTLNINDDEEYNYEDMTKIDGMVQKANALYLRGEVEQALKVYEQISVYNASLSHYNLGVAQMNEGAFKEALESFKKALSNGENQSVAAINAAVCSFKLNDKEKFKYYIDLAQIYLPKEGKSKLYEYYLSLINYYKGYYPEALQMLEKTKIEPYGDTAKYLAAKIYTKLDLENQAIKELNTQESFETSLSLGLLYARIGKYEEAKEALFTAMKIERDFNKSLAAISLVDLKTGNYEDMLTRLHTAYPSDGDKYKILDTHKIKARLNKELFNIRIAQSKFSKDLLKDPKNQFDLLFYFAPFQVFDSKQASLYIKKANINSFLNDSTDTGAYLNTSAALSSTNVKMAHIIALALNQKLKLANQEFQKLLQEYPEHSILHYNLALTYAQLENYELAYKHFTNSYYLNPKNYQAGAFAMFAGKLLDIDTTKLYHEILENIGADPNFKASMQKTMLFLANSDYAPMLPYLDESKEETALNLIFEAIIAKTNGLSNQVDVKIAKLNAKLPQDILSNILYFNSLNENLNIREYVINAQIYFENLKLDYRTIFGGANIARNYYVSLMQIAGLLNSEREKFKKLINTTTTEDESMVQTLAYLDIFAGQFQEAYGLYNSLIDDYQVKDSRTLFLAAVAAIGANNPNSAIALLQLSRLNDAKNNESKAALALLYQEANNYEAALNQYKNLNNFKSKFFTFDIVN